MRPSTDFSPAELRSPTPRRVLFVIPVVRACGGMVEHEDGAGLLPPLGVLYVAAAARACGHSVRLLDLRLCTDGEAEAAAVARDWDADVLAMPCFMDGLADCVRAAEAAKAARPGLRVVFGGPQATLRPQECLAPPVVDAVVLGEGEITFCAYLRDLDDEDAQVRCPGLWTRRGRSARRPLVKDLDSLPDAAYDLLDFDRYFCTQKNLPMHRAINVVSARGCPRQCTYCALSLTLGRAYRPRSVARVTAELDALRALYGFEAFMFYDDIFSVNRKRTLELCAALSAPGAARHRWSCCTRADCVDAELLARMREAGCQSISMGLETGSQRLLDRIRKGTTVEMGRAAVKLIQEAGIVASANFMLGLPTETPEETKATIEFALRAGLDHSWFMVAEPFEGTEMYDDARENGAFEELRGRRVWVPTGRSSEELARWLGLAAQAVP